VPDSKSYKYSHVHFQPLSAGVVFALELEPLGGGHRAVGELNDSCSGPADIAIIFGMSKNRKAIYKFL
jgi:hypothetical protein